MTNLLITSPFKKHGVVDGLLKDLDRSDFRLVLYNYNEKPSADVTQHSDFVEYRSPFPLEKGDGFNFQRGRDPVYLSHLSDIMKEEDIDLVIPTNERFLSLIARNPKDFEGRVYMPSNDVLNLNFDKAQSYDFYSRNGIPTPYSIRLSAKNPQGLEKFLEQNGGEIFVKPTQSSGGQRTNKITSVEEFNQNYGDFDGELIASELLNLPEYTHTLLVNNGEVRNPSTYVGPGSADFYGFERQVVDVSEIEEMGRGVVDALVKHYGAESVNGAYNMDFLTNSSGKYILTEVNPGRLPGGHSAITNSGLNIARAYVEEGLKSQGYENQGLALSA